MDNAGPIQQGQFVGNARGKFDPSVIDGARRFQAGNLPNAQRWYWPSGALQAMDVTDSQPNRSWDRKVQRSNAYQNISEFVQGIAGPGTKSPIWSNITTGNSSPINVRASFFDVLQKWEAAIPLNELWMVFFTIPQIVTDEAMSDWGENSIVKPVQETGSINQSKAMLTKPEFQQHIGCAFAQTVQIPPEQIAIDQVGIPNSRGFLSGPVIQQRQRFASLNIEFLETNVSFVDFLIRPWAILGSHFGAVARQDVKIRTNVMLVNFAKAGVAVHPDPVTARYMANEEYSETSFDLKNTRGFVPRKIWMFDGCQPINISQERYSHTSEGSVDRRDTEWIFKKYQVMLPDQLASTFNQVQQTEKQDVENLYKHDIPSPVNDPEKESATYWGINRGGQSESQLTTKDAEGEYIHQSQANPVNAANLENAAAEAAKYWSGLDYDPASETEYVVIDGVRQLSPEQKKWVPGKPLSSGGYSKDGGQPRTLADYNSKLKSATKQANTTIDQQLAGEDEVTRRYMANEEYIDHDKINANRRTLETSHGIQGNDALNPLPSVQKAARDYGAGPPQRYGLNPVTARRGSDVFSLLFGI